MPSNAKKPDLFGSKQSPRGGIIWPVRKGSVAGAVDSMPLAPTRRESRRRRARIMQHARHYERVTRTRGPRTRNGALGYVGLAVLQTLLYDFHNLASGATFPKQITIASFANVCPRSVARAVARLKRAGFLSWTMRSKPVADDDAPGGYSQRQDSNWYYFSEPELHRPPERARPPDPPAWATGAPAREHFTVGELTKWHKAAGAPSSKLATLWERGDASDADRFAASLLRAGNPATRRRQEP